MRALIKYISLLLFSGLIVPFCFQLSTQTSLPLKSGQLISAKNTPLKNPTHGILFIARLVKNAFPVLKSLNPL
ncbi:hypothetical protein [Mucilaginibacter sp. SG564]|uniref:hypothetical protein n=1 Tax=unclassified Mucilaginibacter TaxID=2617802 RepID=UPI001552D377|nr:hypothetical protein [Mucilaginibacter sp. SG564]NOW94564.1 hypothetical protein [Mucilaginibacter sp. SG564]